MIYNDAWLDGFDMSFERRGFKKPSKNVQFIWQKLYLLKDMLQKLIDFLCNHHGYF